MAGFEFSGRNRVEATSDMRQGGAHVRTMLPVSQLIGYAAAAMALVLITFFSYHALQVRERTATDISKTSQGLERLQIALSILKDAETGQRGFLITGQESYLSPYTNANAELPSTLKNLRELLEGDKLQLERLDGVERKVSEKLRELGETIALQRAGKREEALSTVRADRGRVTMDKIRSDIREMELTERNHLQLRQQEWQEAVDVSYAITMGGSALLFLLIALAAFFAARDFRIREQRLWLRAGQNGFGERIQGEQSLESLGSNALEFLAGFMKVRVGAVYIAEHAGQYRRFAAYATEPAAATEVLRRGESLLGQAAKAKEMLHIGDVPDHYLDVVSGTGRGKPAQLLVAPAMIDGIVYGVVELGFFHPLDDVDLELVSSVSHTLAVAIRSARERQRREELLAETQRQAEELQTQQEELRVTNEELEEQSRALKASQAQLESQHAELEQTNAQLEEQTQLLEHQKDDLSRTQIVLKDKASELERSNLYKSEFLANMSHELRTPLNSTLILSKLLADNKDGNLSAEQVKFAQTISSAGNDLLTLINDILDLSKIEAGKIDIKPEQISVTKTVDSLLTLLQPLARQKGLTLRSEIAQGAVQHIETDTQRLSQILRNLLSNAIKFTARGEVVLAVSPEAGGILAFAIRDTGIGIPENQHEIIFEAFRQADGSTHRKYGGTGLGLSISRDLARLLGGEITVQSEPEKGSTFTLSLPLRYAGKPANKPESMVPAANRPVTPFPASTSGNAAKKLAPSPALIEDDRDRLNPDMQRILIVEDDAKFSGILRDLAWEMGFQCILAQTGTDGIAAAGLYRPNAILLDIHLPDFSGLGVLDHLKREPQTRHIPVHIVSVEDYAHEAMERGAIGYALKPVKREQLVDAFRRLEAKFTQDQRRVLIVEDDSRQRGSMQALLGTPNTEIIGVENAADALAQLQAATFDCMVMDLNLPDLSGYELLEKMAARDDIAFPPVIVYTGRLLSPDEEQNLRRFSKSIIIKDARSPERLLDEVTLFLHQVESTLPAESQRILKAARNRESLLDGRRILVVEDDVRNIFALSSVLEPKGAKVEIARNGIEALELLSANSVNGGLPVDLVLMDIMMPEMDGLTAMQEIRKRPEWKRLPIIALTAKAMRDDQEKCLAAGANDYIAKPLDIERLLSLVRVWMPK